MTRTDVQKLYTRLGGRWWDPFRAVWEFLTCRRALSDLESLMRQYITAETRVLDVGCGTGGNLGRLVRHGIPFGMYTGMDFAPHMLTLARKRFGHVQNASFVERDATDLEQIGERYEVITSTWLLDHLERPAEFVNSVQSLLAPGGHLLLLFYSEPKWFLRFWLSPCGKLSVLADPVPKRETSKFSGVVMERSYCAGVATLVDIAPAAPSVSSEAVA